MAEAERREGISCAAAARTVAVAARAAGPYNRRGTAAVRRGSRAPQLPQGAQEVAAVEDQAVLLERRDGVAILTLNEPEHRNSLSDTLRVALDDHIQEVSRDASVRAVVLAANGKDFC